MKKRIKSKLKRFAAAAIAAAMSVACFAFTAYADEEKKDAEAGAQEQAGEAAAPGKWIQVEAVVVKAEGDAAEGYTITAKVGEETIVYHASDGATIIFNQSSMAYADAPTFKEGDKLLVAYTAATPMALSSPAQMTPPVIVILNGKEGLPFIKVDVFTEGLSSDGKLKIGRAIPAENLLDASGERSNIKDLDGAALLVFYTVSTKSIPPQTEPDRVIVIDSGKPNIYAMSDEEFVKYYIDETLGGAVAEKDGVEYVQLRALFEALGYELEWNKEGYAVLTLEDVSYRITPGKVEYTVNGKTEKFTAAPYNSEGRIYIESSFIAKAAR